MHEILIENKEIMSNFGIIPVDTNFIRSQYNASHLICHDGKAAFVDVGTSNNIKLLEDALTNNNLDKGDVEFVFLTHVHLDHAGGAGKLMQKLPNAKLVVHPYGAKHMLDPSKLIASSERVYGKNLFSQLFGEVLPVEEQKILSPEDGQELLLNNRTMRIFYTEGHARHHYCIYDEYSKSVFSGDSFGMSLREFDSKNGSFIIPITAPTQFDPTEAHNAIDKIIKYQPDAIYLAHYSKIEQTEKLSSNMHDLINDFVDIALSYKNDDKRMEHIHKKLQSHLMHKLRSHGCNLGDDQIKNLLQSDLYVNAAGLDFWLTKNAS